MTQIHPSAPVCPSPKLSLLLSECLATSSSSVWLTRALNLSSKLSLLLLFPVTLVNITGCSVAWALSLSSTFSLGLSRLSVNFDTQPSSYFHAAKITSPAFIPSPQDASLWFWQSLFPACSSMPTAVSRLPLSSHVAIHSPNIKHNIILLCTGCSHAAILDNPWHHLSAHIQEPFTSVMPSFYIALPDKVKLSVKTYITLPLCTFNFSPGVFLFHRLQNTRLWACCKYYMCVSECKLPVVLCSPLWLKAVDHKCMEHLYHLAMCRKWHSEALVHIWITQSLQY